MIIDGRNFITTPSIGKTALPHAPGVYVFLRGNQILYVGMYQNINQRIKSSHHEFHNAKAAGMNKIGHFQTDEKSARIIEQQIIQRHTPLLNG